MGMLFVMMKSSGLLKTLIKMKVKTCSAEMSVGLKEVCFA